MGLRKRRGLWVGRVQIQGLDICLKLTKLDVSDNALASLKVPQQGLG